MVVNESAMDDITTIKSYKNFKPNIHEKVRSLKLSTLILFTKMFAIGFVCSCFVTKKVNNLCSFLQHIHGQDFAL